MSQVFVVCHGEDSSAHYSASKRKEIANQCQGQIFDFYARASHEYRGVVDTARAADAHGFV